MAVKSRRYNRGNRARRYKTMKGGSRLNSIRSALSSAAKKVSSVSSVLSRSRNIKDFCESAAKTRLDMIMLIRAQSLNNIIRDITKKKKMNKKFNEQLYIKKMFIEPYVYYFYITRILPNQQTIYLLSNLDEFVEVGENGSASHDYPSEIVTPELESLKKMYDSFDDKPKEERLDALTKKMDWFINLVGSENAKILKENKTVISPEIVAGNIQKCKNHILGYPSKKNGSLDTHFKDLLIDPGENISEKLKEYLNHTLGAKSVQIDLNSLPPVDVLPPGFKARLARLRDSSAGRKLHFKRGSRSKARKGKKRSYKKKQARAY